MIINIDLESMPPSTRDKMERIIKRLERAGKQANRVAPHSYSIIGPAQDKRILGIKRIQEWALGSVRPHHMDMFVKSIGDSICNLLFYHRCDICPAKKHKRNQNTCTSLLGVYALTEFEKGEKL